MYSLSLHGAPCLDFLILYAGIIVYLPTYLTTYLPTYLPTDEVDVWIHGV